MQLKWPNGSNPPSLPELYVPCILPTNNAGDVCQPELQATSTTLTPSTTDSIDSLPTEPEVSKPITPIHGSNSLVMFNPRTDIRIQCCQLTAGSKKDLHRSESSKPLPLNTQSSCLPAIYSSLMSARYSLIVLSTSVLLPPFSCAHHSLYTHAI